jgi:hypothetical protein
MTSLGDQTKGFIKGNNMLNAIQGDFQAFTDPAQCLLGKPGIFTLNVQQDLKQRTCFPLVFVNDPINELFELLVNLRVNLLANLRVNWRVSFTQFCTSIHSRFPNIILYANA